MDIQGRDPIPISGSGSESLVVQQLALCGVELKIITCVEFIGRWSSK